MAGGASVSSRPVAKLMAGIRVLGGDAGAMAAAVGLDLAVAADRSSAAAPPAAPSGSTR